ncbi:uncharacterized protein LOC134840602 isoform X2 [Symsagittifera roscoffensis]
MYRGGMAAPPQRGYPPQEFGDMEPDLDYRPPRQRSPPPPGPGYVKSSKHKRAHYSSSPDSNDGGYVVPNQRVKEKKAKLYDHMVASSSSSSKHRHGMKVVSSSSKHGPGTHISPTTGVYVKPKKKSKHRPPSSSSSEAGVVSESEPGASSDEGGDSSDARLDSDESISSEKLRGYHAVVVRNLPKRHKDQTIKEGLFFEFKKIGKAVCIKLEGSGKQRIAFCYFRTADECKRIVKEKDQKTFYGKAMEIDPIAQVRQEREQQNRMGVAANFQGGIAVPNNRYDPGIGIGGQQPAQLMGMPMPSEHQPPQGVNELDPKCSRTLFIGNVPREIEETDLYKIFRKYGKILDIDVKRMQYGEVTYAFVQYAHLITCVEAINCEEGRKIGPYRCKTNFAKTTPSACLWASGLPEDVNKMNLKRHFSRPHPVSYFVFDQKLGEALIYYQDVNSASEVLATVKTKKIDNTRPYVDFSSKEHQDYIMKCMKNKGDGGTRYSCSPSPNRGRGYSNSPMRRDNRRRSPSDSPPRGGGGPGTRGSPQGGGPGRFSPSRRHGSNSSNRSSRSPSNNGNVGGRENAKHYSKTFSVSRRSLQNSRSRSPSKTSNYSGGMKSKGRHESQSSRSSSRLNRSPNTKTKKYEMSSSNDEHEWKSSKKSKERKEKEKEAKGGSSKLTNGGSPKKPTLSVPPFRPSVHLSSRSTSKSNNEKKSKTKECKYLKSERGVVKNEILSEGDVENEDKLSSELEEGEFSATSKNADVSAHKTPSVTEAQKEPPMSVSVSNEPYEECDIMMSDHSDIEGDVLDKTSEERGAEEECKMDEDDDSDKTSKNEERPLCDVDRGGTTDLKNANLPDILSSLKKRPLHTMDDLKINLKSTGHFLELTGDDVGENRPHSPRVATALLQNNAISPNLSFSSTSLDLAGLKHTANKLKDDFPLSQEDFAFNPCESPTRALDVFLSQARAKASTSSAAATAIGVDKKSGNEQVSLIATSSIPSLPSMDCREKEGEEQHETDEDEEEEEGEGENEEAIGIKMSAMENELQLEDISSPEQSFSDTDTNSQSRQLAQLPKRQQHKPELLRLSMGDSVTKLEKLEVSISISNQINEQQSPPKANRDEAKPRISVITPSVVSPIAQLFVAKSPDTLPAQSASTVMGRQISSNGENMNPPLPPLPQPVVIPTVSVFAQPTTPTLDSPIKPATPSRKELSSMPPAWPQLEYNQKSPTAKPSIMSDRKGSTEHQVVHQKRSAHGPKVIPLEPLPGAHPVDPRIDIPSGLVETSLKTVTYQKVIPKSPRGDSGGSGSLPITESQSIIEDWKRRGIVKPKFPKGEPDEQSGSNSNPANLQRVNELLNKFNVTSIFDQDSQRLSVLDPDRKAVSSAVSPASIASQRSYDFTYPSPTAWGNTSPHVVPPASSVLNIEIPSPSSIVKKEPLHGILKSPGSISSLKSDEQKGKSKEAPPPFPSLHVNVGAVAASAPNSLCETVAKTESIRVSDKYQRKPAAAASKLTKLTIKTEDFSGGLGNIASSIPSPVSSVSSNSSSCNAGNELKSPATVMTKVTVASAPVTPFASLKEQEHAINRPVLRDTAGNQSSLENTSETAYDLNVSIVRNESESDTSNACPNTKRSNSIIEPLSKSNSGGKIYAEEKDEERLIVDNSLSSTQIKIEPEIFNSVNEIEKANTVETTVITSSSSVESVCTNRDHSDNEQSSKVEQTTASNTINLPDDSVTTNSTQLQPYIDEQPTNPKASDGITTIVTASLPETNNDDISLLAGIKISAAKDIAVKSENIAQVEQYQTATKEKTPGASVEMLNSATSKTTISVSEKKVFDKLASFHAPIPEKPRRSSALVAPTNCEKIVKKEKKFSFSAKQSEVVGISNQQLSKKNISSIKESPSKCADVDIFNSSSKPKSSKHKGYKKHSLDHASNAQQQVQNERKISDKMEPTLDRGEESSENEAEKQTLEKLMSGNQTQNKTTAQAQTAVAVKENDQAKQNKTSNVSIDSNLTKSGTKVLPNISTGDNTVNAVQKVTGKHHKKHKKDKEGKSVNRIENAEDMKSMKQFLMQDVNKTEKANSEKNISTHEKMLHVKKTSKICASDDLPNASEKKETKKEQVSPSVCKEKELLEVETVSLVSQTILEPLKVEVEESVLNKSEQSVLTSLKSHPELTDYDTPIPDYAKSKSAPVSIEKGGHSPSTPNSSMHKKKRPYVEIVVDETDEQENIDYVQHQLSRPDGIEICIKKVKPEQLPFSNDEEEHFPTPVKKAKFSPKKHSVDSKRKEDENVSSPIKKSSPKSARSPISDDGKSTEAASERSATPKSVASCTSTTAAVCKESDSEETLDELIIEEYSTCSKLSQSETEKEADSDKESELNIECDTSVCEYQEIPNDETCESLEDTLGTSFSTDEAIEPDYRGNLEVNEADIDLQEQVYSADCEKNIKGNDECATVEYSLESAPSGNNLNALQAEDKTSTAEPKGENDWININGENFHRMQETSSAKNGSVIQLAETILGVIESNLPSQESLSSRHIESHQPQISTFAQNPLSAYMAQNTTQFGQQSSVSDNRQDKMFEFLAGLSTTSAITNYSAMSSSPIRPPESFKEPKPNIASRLDVDFTEPETTEDNATDDTEPDQSIIETYKRVETAALVVDSNVEFMQQNVKPSVGLASTASSCESTEAESSMHTESSVKSELLNDVSTSVHQFSPDETEADDEETKPVAKGPTRGYRRRKSKRTRFSRPPRKQAQVPKVKSENAVSDAESVETAQVESTVPGGPAIDYRSCRNEETDAFVEKVSRNEIPTDLPPLPARFNSSASSSSGTSLPETPTPTSPIVATMHPKERLKKQFRAFMAAEHSNKLANLGTPTTPASEVSLSARTAISGSSSSLPSSANLNSNIKSEQLTVQSPMIFSFNEPSPRMHSQPKVKSELASPVFERTTFPSTISQEPVQSAATIIKRVAAPSSDPLRMLAPTHRTVPTISQELSLERDKRRNELKQLTSLSDAEIDNVEACIESVLQDNSILVKRFRCTADIEPNWIDPEVRESAELLESSIEELTNFRLFQRSRKRNNAGVPAAPGSSILNRQFYSSSISGSDLREHRAVPLDNRSATPSSLGFQLSNPAMSTAEAASNAIQSSIDSVILRHSEVGGTGRKYSGHIEDIQPGGHPSPDIVQNPTTKGYAKHLLSMSSLSSGDHVSNAKEPRLSNSVSNYSSTSNSSGRIASPTAAVTPNYQHSSAVGNAFSPKSLIGMPLPFDSANPLLQNLHNNAAFAAAAASNNSLLRSAEAFRIEHSAANSLLGAATSSANASSSSSGAGNGGGDMHININLMAHYPAYHPDILPALYGNPSQSAPTRLVTLQIPSTPVDPSIGIESHVFVARTSNLYTMFNKLQNIWEGTVELKNSQAQMNLRFLGGNVALAVGALHTTTLNINQRMTLEEQELEGLTRNLLNEGDYCVMLGLPHGPDPTQIYTSNKVLHLEVAKYLQHKEAAGIINIPHKYMDRETLSVLHIFPPCEFARKYLMKLDLFLHLNTSPSSYLLFILTSADVAARSSNSQDR